MVRLSTLEQKLWEACGGLSVTASYVQSQMDTGLTPSSMEDVYFSIKGIWSQLEWIIDQLPPDSALRPDAETTV